MSGLMEIISILAMLTMTLGNVAALRQSNLKRLMAYSSISHAGFFLMGAATLDEVGRQAVYIYIPIYLLMNIGAFMGLIYMVEGNRYQLSDYKGLIRKSPLLVVFFAIMVFNLAGIPPFAGFIGKFYLFKAVLERGLFFLAIIAGINSVVSLYYYVNILKVMIIDEPDESGVTFTENKVSLTFIGICAIPLVVLGVYWQPVLDWVEKIPIIT